MKACALTYQPLAKFYAYGYTVINMPPENQYYGYAAPGTTPDGDPNKLKRIIIFSVIGVTVFFMLIAAYLLLFTSPTLRPDVVKVAAMHNEINRIAELGLDSDRARRGTKQSAANAKIISANNRADVAAYAGSEFKGEVTPFDLSSEENMDIDAILAEAAEVNNYDDEFAEIMTSLLSQANDEITRVFGLTSDEELQRILNEVGTKNQTLLDSFSN